MGNLDRRLAVLEAKHRPTDTGSPSRLHAFALYHGIDTPEPIKDEGCSHWLKRVPLAALRDILERGRETT